MPPSKLQDLSNLLTARLSRHIAFWVFASLILIEVIILIPSVKRREQEMLNQIQQVSSAKVLWVSTVHSLTSAEEFLAEVKQLQQDPTQRIRGGALYQENGVLVGTFGELPELSLADVATDNPAGDWEIVDRFFPVDDRYDVAWLISSAQNNHFLILRHDAASVRTEIHAFILRIAGLVLIIAVVITWTTLAVLSATVITPILRLRQDLLMAGDAISHDRPVPSFHAAAVKRQDELGEVIAAFNQMFWRIWQAMSDRKQAEQELAAANQEITVLNQRLTAENLRMSAELGVSRKLQQMLLPKEDELGQIPGLEISGFMEPAAEVGGDYYDVLNQNGKIKISIGDVTGHGLESGVLMLMAQTATRTLLSHSETNPVKFLSTLNRTIYENVKRMGCDKSLTLALLDYHDGKVWLSGQHEEILVIRDQGQIERIDTLTLGFPLGLEADITDLIAQAQIQLSTGDGIVLYTDGITEALNAAQECYGVERLCQVIQQHWYRSPQAIRQAVIDDVRQYIGDQTVHDDITLLVLKQK